MDSIEIVTSDEQVAGETAAVFASAICLSGASSGDFIVAQASRLWGHRASCLVFELLGNVNSAGETPTCPTGKMPVLRHSS